MFNVDEGALADEALRAELAALVAPAEAVVLCAQIEAEVAALDPRTTPPSCWPSYGQDESGLVQLVAGRIPHPRAADVPDRRAEGVAGLDHPIGDTAPEAAGVIHTDFQRGFIKAEIVSLRRPDRGRLGRRRPGRGQGPHRGQGLRDARRRRGGVPLQRVVIVQCRLA